MYCVNCGVKLSDTESACPLCGVRVYHPDLDRGNAEPLYPGQKMPEQQVSSKGAKIIATTVFLLPILITLICDHQINDKVTWSGYVVGGLMLAYIITVLPYWFHKPNPVIFVSIAFGAIMLFLLYINLHLRENWFMTFAFPVTGGVGLIVTAVVALMRYVPKGNLYTLGGANIALGAFMPVIEYLSCITFGRSFVAWSFYPLASLVLLGSMLIFLAICRPARESVERRFFI